MKIRQPKNESNLATLNHTHPSSQYTDSFIPYNIWWAGSNQYAFPCQWKKYSAGDLDSLRSQHLRDLTDPLANSGAQLLLNNKLISFLTLVLEGGIRQQIYFFDATFTVLHKKVGRIRRIAVGCPLILRLAPKAAGSKARKMHSITFGTLSVSQFMELGEELKLLFTCMYIQILSQDYPSSSQIFNVKISHDIQYIQHTVYIAYSK